MEMLFPVSGLGADVASTDDCLPYVSRYCFDRSSKPRSSGLVSLSMEMKCFPAKPERAEMDMVRLVLPA